MTCPICKGKGTIIEYNYLISKSGTEEKGWSEEKCYRCDGKGYMEDPM